MFSALSAWHTSRLRGKGDAARDAGSWKIAAAFFRRYLERVPHDAKVWVEFGRAQQESGDPAGAELAYRRALALEPGNPDSWVQLGHAVKLQGDFGAAAGHYRKAFELDPKFAPALREMGDSSPAIAASPASSNSRLAELEQTVARLSEQLGAVKSVAFEVHRLRGRLDELDRQLEELTELTARLSSRDQDGHTDLKRRLASLESRSPAVQARFSNLLEQFSTISAYRQDLDRQAARIDALVDASNRPA